MKISPEVLAPAGSWESLRAAAAAGADAVYFGGSSFNARRNAENFTDEDIPKVVSYCHERGIKAYFTLNTIVFDSETHKVLKLAKLVCDAGADAFILQDAGLASLIHQAAPKAKLHASTQMSVHNINGVMELAKMGFSRVVLARELSKQEIAAIAENSPIELEVFVHGALCMSVSGQCYLSAFFGGSRSGNRGLCAQPCRLPFTVGKDQNVLSLKDLSLVKNIKEIADMGVTSLKIEGRMKRPEYVAAVTSVCKKAAAGQEVTQEDEDALRKVFSRSGFTQGYYDAKRDREMFGTRSREDVVSMESILKRFHSIYDGVERQRIKADFDLKINKDSVTLKVRDNDGNTVTINGKKPEIAINRAIDGKTAAEKLAKTGSTPFFAGNIETTIEPGLTVPVSEINGLRRDALSKLLEMRGKITPIPFKEPTLNMPDFSTEKRKIVEKYRLRFYSADQIPEGIDLSKTEIVFLPLSQICEGKADRLISEGARVGAEIPRAVFSGTEKLIEQLKEAKRHGVNDALCGNVGAINCATSAGLNVHADFGLNITNSVSLEVYARNGAKSCVISFETPLAGIRSIASHTAVPCGIIAYGRIPVMLVRNCPVRSFAGCKKGGCSITDRKGCAFPLLCGRDNNGGASEILNSRPIWLADRKNDILGLGLNFIEFYFTTENAKQVKDALNAFETGGKYNGDFTRGLYFHEVV